MMKRWIALFTVIASLSIFIIGCTNEPQKSENKSITEKVENNSAQQPTPQKVENNPVAVLVGKWDRISGTNPERVEFLPDNTMIFGKDLPRSTNYRLIDNERIEIKDVSGALILNFKVTGDTLLLGNGPDETTYRKVP